MKKQRVTSSGILNKLHRAAVYTCIGVTLYGTFMLGMRAYNFYTVVKPAREKAELQKLQEAAAVDNKAKDLQC